MTQPWPIAIRDESGTTRLEGDAIGTPGGGSQVKVVRVPFMFDSAGIVLAPGIAVYTPAAGQVLLAACSWVSVTTVWDGTTPKLHIVPQGEGNGYEITDFVAISLDTPNSDSDPAWEFPQGTFGTNIPPVVLARTATPWVAYIDDGNGGDPGSTAGVGEIGMTILTAS